MRCPTHPDRRGVAACAVCGRPVCDLCRGQIDDVDFCPPHFEIEEARIHRAAYGLAPLPAPASVPEALIGVWAVAGAISPWMPWYRIDVPGAPILHETGWVAGGFAPVACVALIASGVTLGVMVAVRVIRSRMMARENVTHAAVGFGAASFALVALRIVTRTSDLDAGAYMAVTSSALVLYLGYRLRQ